MIQKIRSFVIFILLGAVPVATAQEPPSAIELFEGQEKMSTGAIAVESSDGSPLRDDGEGWDGSSSARVDGGITLSYERNGASILVPARIEGKSVYFIFDTGATYTTLTTEFARSVGIAPGKDSPQMMLQTANGKRAAGLGIINSLKFGGRNHSGVTYTVCDGCPSGTHNGKPLVGLLGMNVIGRYRTSFDDGRGVIEMLPSIAFSDRTRDVEPWISVDYDRSVVIGKAVKLDATIRNRAPRRIAKLEVSLVCTGGAPTTWSKPIGARGTAKIKQSIHDGNCADHFDLRVAKASW